MKKLILVLIERCQNTECIGAGLFWQHEGDQHNIRQGGDNIMTDWCILDGQGSLIHGHSESLLDDPLLV